MNNFEYNLARSCAPALAGLKVSNLMCCIDIVNDKQKNELGLMLPYSAHGKTNLSALLVGTMEGANPLLKI